MTNQKRGSDKKAKKSVVDLEKLVNEIKGKTFRLDKKYANLVHWKGEMDKDLTFVNIWRIKDDEEFFKFKEWEKEVKINYRKDKKNWDTMLFMVFDDRERIKKNKEDAIKFAKFKENFDRVMKSCDEYFAMCEKRDQDDVNKIKPLVGLA